MTDGYDADVNMAETKKCGIAIVIPPAGTGNEERYVGMKESLPHIGVAYLAANIDRTRYDIRVYDSTALGMSRQAVAAELEEFNPRVIGYTAMTCQIMDAQSLAREMKKRLPAAVSVIGGYHVSAVPEETIAGSPEFDIAVCGEGELTFSELLDALNEGVDVAGLSGIAGLCYREGGQPRLTPPRPFIENLDALNFPAYDLMPMEKYAGFYRPLMFPKRTVPLSTGRGCLYHCIFCYKATGDKYRVRAIDAVIDELKRDIRDFGIGEFVVTDESFLTYRDRITKFCELLIKDGICGKVKWICQSRVDHAEPELLKLMRRAGCRVIAYGIESGNPEIIKKIRKGITHEQAMEAVRWTRRAGILADTNFIIGHPGDTRETIRETVSFAMRLNADLASFSLLVPFPGTEVARMAERGEGGLRRISRDYSSFGKQVGGAMELESVPRTELERLQRNAYIRFFLRPSKIINLLRVVDLRMLFSMAMHAVSPKKR